MPSLSTYDLTGISLTLDVGYLLTATAPDLGREVAPLSHSCAMQPPHPPNLNKNTVIKLRIYSKIHLLTDEILKSDIQYEERYNKIVQSTTNNLKKRRVQSCQNMF